MSFVYPQFLWALTALSIPILIHLFNFRKTIRVFFSNTRFLKQVKQETTQKRKLKQYLILASRLLFLFFLVIAFAQPFLPAKEQITSGKDIIIYLDNSFSMSAQAAEKTRALDAASALVQDIAKLFPADTRFRLLTNDFAPFSNSFKTKTELLDLLAQLRLSPISRTAEEIRRKIGDPASLDVFWISDFQKSTMGSKEKSGSGQLSLDSLHSWHLIPISPGKVSNVFVDSVHLENPFIIGGEKIVVKVRLHNSGPRKSEGLIVKLTINGTQAATAAATLEPNSSAEVSFDLTSGLKPRNEAKISFNDFPVSFDNEFYFTLNFVEKINVTEVKATAASTYLEKVYGNDRLFNFKSFQVGNVNYSLLNQADLVVLNGLHSIDEALTAALTGYQAQSGSLLFIPGGKPDLTSFQRVLKMPALKLLEAPEWIDLDKPDFQNPFFENVFEERSLSLAMPKARKLLDWGPDRSAILKFRNGQPFLSQNEKTFLLASPLEKEFTDFYNHALFVPVMYRVAASGRRHENRAYYTVDENLVTVKADSLRGEEPLQLVGAQEIIPPQRRVGDKVYLEVVQFAISPGFYRIMNQQDTLDLIAFNLDKEESYLDHYSGAEAKAFLGGSKNIFLFEASSLNTFSNEIKERYLGTPLWKQALLMALLFLLAEVLLIRFLK